MRGSERIFGALRYTRAHLDRDAILHLLPMHKNKRFTPPAVNYFQFSRSSGECFPLADAVNIVLSGVLLLLSAEEPFDLHYMHHLNQCLPATDLLYVSLSDYSKEELICIEMLLAS